MKLTKKRHMMWGISLTFRNVFCDNKSEILYIPTWENGSLPKCVAARWKTIFTRRYRAQRGWSGDD